MSSHIDPIRAITWWLVVPLTMIATAVSVCIGIDRATAATATCAQTLAAPKSEAAEACRAEGWTVRRIVTVGPKGYVRAVSMPACEMEDSAGPCYWDARTLGNGKGTSFYVTPNDRVVYVKGFRIGGAR